MNKIEEKELKLYESLGVKTFRKMAFKLRDTLSYPFLFFLSKSERHDALYNSPSNYVIGPVKSEKDLNRYKKWIYFNAAVHFMGLISCMPTFTKIFTGAVSLPTAITNITFVGINLYCIMLQRYNNIRIKDLIKRMGPHFERQKNKIKEELKEEDSKLSEHTYSLETKKKKTENMTIDDIIENASIEELKKIREGLVEFRYSEAIPKEYRSNIDNEIGAEKYSIGKNKKLVYRMKTIRD
jgi:hypothetical protein